MILYFLIYIAPQWPFSSAPSMKSPRAEKILRRERDAGRHPRKYIMEGMAFHREVGMVAKDLVWTILTQRTC